MARMKVTSSDIYARVAKGECANFRNGCQGRLPCAVVNGEVCQYFDDYVRPLLDIPEFSQRYAREAKIKLALNPDAKVVRKRRQAGDPILDLKAESTPSPGPDKPAKPAVARAAQSVKPASAPVKKAKPSGPAVSKPRAKAVSTPVPVPEAAPKEKTRRQATEAKPEQQATATSRKAVPQKPVVAKAETAPPKPSAKSVPGPVEKTAKPPARRQAKSAVKPDEAPVLQLVANAEVAPKRAAKKPAAEKQAPVVKRTIMITPQLELVLDFPLERPSRAAGKRR